MLGKLIKYEFKVTSKVLIPIHIFLVVITMIGILLLKTKVFQNDDMIFISIGFAGFYIFTLLAGSFAVTVYLFAHLYRNLFTKQGYLMFTLPVLPSHLLYSKSIVGFFWYILNTVTTLLSSVLLILAADGLKFFNELTGSKAGFAEIFGFTPVQFLLLFMIFSIVSSFYSLSVINFSILIGQLFEKYRIVAAGVTYFIIYIIQQILSTLLFMPTSYYIFSNISETNTIGEALTSFYRSLFIYMVIINFILAVIFNLVSRYIINKKINLE